MAGREDNVCSDPSNSGAEVRGVGWPRAALMSLRSRRVVAWKSLSVERHHKQCKTMNV